MTKKFLALTMVLVLAAGFAAVAAEHEDDRALTGTWENELTLDPTASNTFAGYDSELSVEYALNGINYSSNTWLNLTGMTKQEFGVDTSVGLLDLSSTLNMDVNDADLRFWETSADLTLGGVSIGTTFYLQNHDWSYSSSSSYEANFWPENSASSAPDWSFGAPSDPQTASYGMSGSTTTSWDSYVFPYSTSDPTYDGDDVGSFHDYGSGLELTFSGETPGGVSVDVTNTFGMMPESDAESYLTDELADQVEDFVVSEFSLSAFSGWSDDVSAQDVIDHLTYQPSATGATTSVDETVVKAWLADQLDVGAWASGSAGQDYATLEERADDYDAYVSDKASKSTGGYDETDPEFSVSGEVRDEYVDALKASLSIYGVADDTGTVVNTEFDVGGAGYDWSVTAADSSDETDASVSFGLANVEVGPGEYGSSSLQYYSTLIELDNLSIGCCDFSNETKFTEHDGFAYSEFDFSMEMETFPIDIDATLEWDGDDGKGVSITPSLSTDWSCFTVYTDLGSADGDIDSLTVEGFEISAEMGHVNVTSITALDDYTVNDLNSDYHAYDEVIAIDKLASAGDLTFGLDYYTDMGSSGNGFMPVALEGTASYPISSQFDLGTGLAWVDDGSVSDPGLQEVSLTFDYSF